VNSIFDMKAPYLTESEIEIEANTVLRSHEAKYGAINTVYTPVEEILEKTLGYSLEVDDFTRGQYFAEVGHNILGFIDVKAKAIFINQDIDPMHNSTATEGRFYFTLAHEIGHGVLHEGLMTEYHAQTSFLYADTQIRPTILCRNPEGVIPSNRPSVEQQADKFASYLLMPTKNITLAMQNCFGRDSPLTYAELDSMGGINQALAPMADAMRVSKTALRIRLENIGLLTDGCQPLLL